LILKRLDKLAEDLPLPKGHGYIEMSGREPTKNSMPDNTQEI